MDDDRSIATALWTMIVIQTIGSVDLPGRGARKMPSPRAYVIIIVAMGTLQLMAEAGATKAAKALAWSAVVAGVVLGPFGARILNFINTVSSTFGVTPTPPTTAPGTGPGGITAPF